MQVDTLTYDGLSGGQVPDQVTTYAYDGYGRVSSQSKLSTTGLLDSSGHGGHAVWSGGVGLGAAGLVGGDSDRALSGLKSGRSDAAGTFLNGAVDEVAVYGTALPAARVSAHRTAGAGYRAAVLADTPLTYYRLDDGTVGTNAGPNAIVSKPSYTWNDAVSATATSATGHYLIDYPAFDDVEDTAGNRYRCSYTG